MKKLLLTLLFCLLPTIVFAATFGYVYSGTEDVNMGGADVRLYCGKFTLSENGTVSKISALLASASGSVNAVAYIYSDDGEPLTILGKSDTVAITTTKGTFDFTFSPGVELTAGDYWLAVQHDGATVYHYLVASGGTDVATIEINFGTAGDNPTVSSTHAYKYCYYATYTAAAAAPAVTHRNCIIYNNIQ
jgi:hypothetical protein